MAIEVNLLNNNNTVGNINTNMQRIKEALQDGVSRSGGTPNQMGTDLDMNSNDILNVNVVNAKRVIMDGLPLVPGDTAVSTEGLYTLIDSMPNIPVPDYLSRIYVSSQSSIEDGLGGMFIDQDNGTPVAFSTPAGGGAIARDWYRAADVSSGRVSKGFLHGNSPMGRGGVRVLVGEGNDAHYGLGSGWVHHEDTGKTVFFYRKGASHAITNGAEVWAADSYDRGATLENHRLLYTLSTTDTRPQHARRFGNGRSGFLANRIAENGDDANPLLFLSDDQWATFTVKELIRPVGREAYSFNSHGGILDFPASQGGHDTLGFIAFGYMSPGQGYDALYTDDNWETYTWHPTKVCVPSAPFSTASEWSGARVGDTDRWIFYCRNSITEAMCFTTDNLLDWGPSKRSHINLGGNPPATFYDEATNTINFVITSRTNRVMYGFENWMLMASADADDLWDADGDWSAVGVTAPEPVMPMPNWFTGYFEFGQIDGSWWATFVAGEDGVENGGSSFLCWLGDFVPSGPDRERWDYYLKAKPNALHELELFALDNSPGTYGYKMQNLAGSLRVGLGAYGLSNKLATAQNLDFNLDIGGYVNVARLRPPSATDMEIGRAGTNTKLAGTVLIAGAAPTATAALVHAPVASTVAAYSTEAGSTSTRKHYSFNAAGVEVGAITTTGAGTNFVGTSDESFKEFIGELDSETAIAVIRADPVREFMWDEAHGGSRAVGWGAQTSYAVSPDLASPGGWFDDEGNECAPDTDGATYVPWGVDQGKRTPYLWAALTWAIDKIEDLEARIATLEVKD